MVRNLYHTSYFSFSIFLLLIRFRYCIELNCDVMFVKQGPCRCFVLLFSIEKHYIAKGTSWPVSSRRVVARVNSRARVSRRAHKKFSSGTEAFIFSDYAYACVT